MATIAQAKPRQRPFRPWRLTVDKYMRMVELGIFDEQDRVFLWKGQLLERMVKHRPHVLAVLRLQKLLARLVDAHSHFVEQEAAMRLVRRKDTLPEPDLKVVRGRPGDYSDMPTTRDVPLVVEVADSSLNFDMRKKQILYAVDSVETYWVVGVEERWIAEFTGPSGPQEPTGYQSRKTYRAGESIPVQLGGIEVGHVAVDQIFAD